MGRSTPTPPGPRRSATGTTPSGRNSSRPATDPIKYRYNAKERDAETGLYDYGARYYDPLMGRFTAPDLPLAGQDLRNPQSWNLYSYCRNNPLRYYDPTGQGAVSVALRTARHALRERLFSAARREAVRLAWKHEGELVIKLGKGTREWTKEEIKELIETGRVKGFQGHHINSVKGHDLAMARHPDNIEFVAGLAENLEKHGGNFQNETCGALMDRLLKLGGIGLIVFFETYDRKTRLYASESPIISDPDSWVSYVNPFNVLVENAALLEAFAAAEAADERAKKEQQRLAGPRGNN